MLEGLKVWAFKRFAGKWARRGIRIGITWVFGKVSVAKLQAVGVTVNPLLLEGAIDAAIWSKLELAANIFKTKFDEHPHLGWLAKLL
jgi:hypothetical protein